MRATCLYRRPSGVYAVRLVVPRRHREAIGRTELHFSTKTTDAALAKAVASGLLAHWRLKFLRLDRMGKMDLERVLVGSPLLTAGGRLSLERAAEVSGFDRADLLQQAAQGGLMLYASLRAVWGHVAPSEVVESSGVGVDASGAPIGPLVGDYTCLTSSLALPDPAGAARELMADASCKVSEFPYGPGWRFVADRPVSLTQTDLEVDAHEVEALRLRFLPGVTRAQLIVQRPKAETRSAPVAKVSSYIEPYLAEKARTVKPDQIRQIGDLLRLFCAMTGDPRFCDVDNALISRFRDEQLAGVPHKEEKHRLTLRTTSVIETIEALKGTDYERLTPGSIKKRMGWLRGFLEWIGSQAELNLKAIDRAGQAAQPKQTKKASEQRDAFGAQDLAQIFSADHFRVGRGKLTKSGTYRTFVPWHYWGPLIALYTGMRPNEVCQLLLDDIQSIDGVWCFDVNDDDGEDSVSSGKSVKTVNSRRIIPIHPELERLGLLAWVKALKDAGFLRLFPEWIPHARHGRFSAMASRWFNDRFLPSVFGKSRSDRKVLYSFRHTFITELYRLGVPEMEVNKLSGHTLGVTESAKRYNKGAEIARLAKIIGDLDFRLPPVSGFDCEAGISALNDALRRKRVRAGRGA